VLFEDDAVEAEDFEVAHPDVEEVVEVAYVAPDEVPPDDARADEVPPTVEDTFAEADDELPCRPLEVELWDAPPPFDTLVAPQPECPRAIAPRARACTWFGRRGAAMDIALLSVRSVPLRNFGVCGLRGGSRTCLRKSDASVALAVQNCISI
jgi:hypothetical protein